MISIIITAFKEPQTIGKAIESFINQKIKDSYELIVTAPDKETLLIAKKYADKNHKIKLYKDSGKGKSYALNLLLKKVKGDIIILTDGDVYVSENSVNEIMDKFKDKDVGCVTGRPVSIEDKSTKYGYWANFLFDSAHNLRKNLKQQNQFLECSGYLWAFRNNIIESFPTDVAEDSIVPYFFAEKDYKIDYAENAEVYVKNVDNWKEWISQKIRTSRAHETMDKYADTNSIPRTKTFFNEAKGIINLFIYPKSFKEFYWTIQLLFARLYMWFKVFSLVYIKKDYHKDDWERVESTK